MSPEQTRSEELDARADLLKFGAVLYEMATGQQTFYGTTTAVIYDSILNRALTLISSVKPQLLPAANLRSELKQLKRDTSSERWVAAAVSGPLSTLGSALQGHREWYWRN